VKFQEEYEDIGSYFKNKNLNPEIASTILTIVVGNKFEEKVKLDD
jgi:hypothetical protein